jgi:hypothetical protein
MGVGVLLWARIIIISNPSRTAIAYPESGPPDHQDALAETRSDNSRPVIDTTMAAPWKRDSEALSSAYSDESAQVAPIVPEREKSAVQQAEDPQLVERRFSGQLQELIDQLRLSAVMTSGEMAVVGGRTYRVGDSITVTGSHIPFSLVEVRQRSVILEFRDQNYELKMRIPGRQGGTPHGGGAGDQ